MTSDVKVAEHKLFETSMNVRLHNVGLFLDYLNSKFVFDFEVDRIVKLVFDTINGSTTVKATYSDNSESVILGVFRDGSLSANVFFFCSSRDMADLIKREGVNYFG